MWNSNTCWRICFRPDCWLTFTIWFCQLCLAVVPIALTGFRFATIYSIIAWLHTINTHTSPSRSSSSRNSKANKIINDTILLLRKQIVYGTSVVVCTWRTLANSKASSRTSHTMLSHTMSPFAFAVICVHHTHPLGPFTDDAQRMACDVVNCLGTRQ